ncbi:hypothetical protein IMCC26134_10590 [Verrucomicrobia bacterium IMCC26134]|nr:hypothetical protein IMCC26134_10590 [Verrucomicrobia bacterium IMCC26134]
MNIAEYAKNKVQAAVAKVSAATAAAKAIENDIKGFETKARDLKMTRDRLVAEEIDKTAVEERLRGVETKTASLVAELKLKNEAVEAATAEREGLKPLEELAELCVEKLKLVEIPEIQSAHELLKHFEVHLKFEDQRATACSFWWLGKGRSGAPNPLFELPLASKESRGRATLIPDAVSWIPDQWLPAKGSRREEMQRWDYDKKPLKPADDLEPKPIYYVIPEDEFSSLSEKVTWRETERQAKPRQQGYQWQQTEWQDVVVTKDSEICEDTTPLIDVLLSEVEDVEINLSGKNEIPYFDEIAKLVIDATHVIGESPYAEYRDAQTTLEIEKILGPFLGKFIDAPWTAETTGILANFKYYCEQRERPRFHNLSIDGLYGFRLRTRDHSWITGRIYIVPKTMTYASPESKVPEIKILNSGQQILARMGRMILLVTEAR